VSHKEKEKMKVKESNSFEVSGVRYMLCSTCGREVKNVGETAISVKCSYCVNAMIPFEEAKQGYKSTGRPPGWHWMNEFVDKDGNVFHKGKEQPKLKGTLKPTKVVKKKIKRRTKTEIEASKVRKYQKKKKAAKKKLKSEIKKQQDFLNHKLDKD